MTTDTARELLQQLCADLRALRWHAGGPSLRALAERVQVSKSQLGAILNGQVRELPDWQVIRGILDSVLRHAEEHHRANRLTLPTGVDEFWRHQYAMVEHAFARAPRPRGALPPAEPEPVSAPQPSATPASQAPPLTVPRQLPPAARHFVGRTAELSVLNKLLSESGPNDAATIVVIDGPAGVGKTAFALQWAHEVADEFPDLQLYANLHGFDPSGQVTSPAEAVRSFLDALGVPPARVPQSLDAQAALYRSLLAGKRALILLDNALDAQQVRPLLPGSPGAFTVVTSRRQLTPLVVDSAHRLPLDLLSFDEARDLLAKRLGDEQMAAPEPVERIIVGCARLPLALAIVAARTQQFGCPLDTIATQLSSGRNRLDALDAGDLTTEVRSVFSWSYASLTPAAARLFRLLGLLAPLIGDHLSPGTAASLVGQDRSAVRPLLAELTRVNLLVEPIPGRYSCHDLLVAYAAELALRDDPPAEQQAATRRLLDYYLRAAHAADQLLSPHPDRPALPLGDPIPGTDLECFTDATAAMAWLTLHRVTLLTALRQATTFLTAVEPDDAGHAGTDAADRYTWQLARVIDVFLRRQGYWQERISAWRAALRAADRITHPDARAQAHRCLATALASVDRWTEADAHLKQALALYEQTGNQMGQAYTRHTLAAVEARMGNLPAALAHAQRELTMFQQVGSASGEALARNAIGRYSGERGDPEEALAQCRRAIVLQQSVGDDSGQAATWGNLGYANHLLGNYAKAVDCYRRSVALCQLVGDRHKEATMLTELGDTLHLTGDVAAARHAWQRAAEILTQLGYPTAAEVRDRLQRLDEAPVLQ